MRAIAFSIADGRSGEIQESQVLPGLSIALVEEALQRSQTQMVERLIAGYCKVLVNLVESRYKYYPLGGL